MATRVGLVRYGSPVGVTPNVDYVWSIYTQATTHPRYCYLEVRWADAAGNPLGVQASDPARNNLDAPIRLALPVKAPAGAATAGLYFGATEQQDNERHLWDGAQWERGQIATAYGPRPGEILPGTVTTPMIAVGAIDASRIAASTITGAHIAPGSIGNAALGDNSITNRELAEGAVLAENVFANAITADKIAANAVTARVIAAEAVVAGHLAANAVTAGAIAANSVTADKVAANAITAGKIAANAVTATNIVAGAVQAVQIAASAITADKMAANSITATNAAIAVGAIGEATIQNGVIGEAKIRDGAIITAKIRDGAILNAKIGTAAIDDAKIGSLSVTKLTGGYMQADVLLAGRIATAASGARVQMTPGGVFAYDFAGQETVAIRGDGSASFRGQVRGSDIVGSAFRTAEYGGRIEIRGDQYGALDQIRWYHDNGSNVGEIRTWLSQYDNQPGLFVNSSRIQIGNTSSVLFQTAIRDVSQFYSRVRAGRVFIGTTNGGPAYVAFDPPFWDTGRTPVVMLTVEAASGYTACYPSLGAVSPYGFNVYLSNGSSFIAANRTLWYYAEQFFGVT